MSSSNDSCKLGHTTGGNTTDPFHIGNPYGGLPQNLITNSIGVAIILLLFMVLRKRAALAWIMRTDDLERLTSRVFNVTADTIEKGIDQIKTTSETVSRRLHRSRATDEDNGSYSAPADLDAIDHSAAAEAEQADADSRRILGDIGRQQSIQTTGLVSWIRIWFTMSDADISEHCGDDALQYLRFQRYIIAYLAVVVVTCICIVLPINFQGVVQGTDLTSFSHTTMANLDPSDQTLYVHILLAFLFFPLALVFMRRFSIGVGFKNVGLGLSRTLMIQNIPPNKVLLAQFLREAFPEVETSHVEVGHDIGKLQELHDDIEKAQMAKEFVLRKKREDETLRKVYPVGCSRYCFLFCCCCVEAVEVEKFYADEIRRLEKEYDEENARVLAGPLPMMFVSFRNINMAKSVHDGFKHSSLLGCKFNPPSSTVTDEIEAADWHVSYAAPPEDIYWENLSAGRRLYLLKLVLVNIALFLILFFLTTPEYILSQTEFIVYLFDEELNLPSWIVDFLPTLMLNSFATLMPLLVAWSDRFLGHYTRSGENHNIMRKTYFYLIFLIIFLPTFGFTTLSGAITFIVPIGNSSSSGDAFRWDCVFLPDSGAFFVNYVITAALVGCGLELLRAPELFIYAMYLCWSKHRAEVPFIRKTLKYEFRFGEQYARLMLIFTMTMMYCISCPLITPFGLMFFLVKYYVDRHNLLFAYAPSKINQRVHSTAINFFVLAVVILQFFTTTFIILRNGSLDLTNMGKLCLFLFLVCVNVFAAQTWADTCKKLSPIEYTVTTTIMDSDINEGGKIYLPSLLRGPRPAPSTVAGGASNNTSPPSVYGSAESKPSSEYGTFEGEEDALRPKTE